MKSIRFAFSIVKYWRPIAPAGEYSSVTKPITLVTSSVSKYANGSEIPIDLRFSNVGTLLFSIVAAVSTYEKYKRSLLIIL